jgi:hypothetical protein
MTVHVKGVPEQDGSLGVILSALVGDGPVNALPLTVESVMTTDCVLAETYFGFRDFA